MTTDVRAATTGASAKAAPAEPLAFLGLPSHVVVLLAASTAGYALLLAAVAGIQSRNEADLAAVRQPAVEGVAQLRAAQDDLTSQLAAAQASYNPTVAAYNDAGGSLQALTSQLGDLSIVVGQIDGVSRSMPATVKLPVMKSSVGSVRSPSTQSTTGASGG